MANTHLIHESVNRKFPLAVTEADELLVLHKQATELTESYKDTLAALVNEAADICNNVDADDELQIIDDCLSDMAGDTYSCWPQFAERMKRRVEQ